MTELQCMQNDRPSCPVSTPYLSRPSFTLLSQQSDFPHSTIITPSGVFHLSCSASPRGFETLHFALCLFQPNHVHTYGPVEPDWSASLLRPAHRASEHKIFAPRPIEAMERPRPSWEYQGKRMPSSISIHIGRWRHSQLCVSFCNRCPIDVGCGCRATLDDSQLRL